MKLNNISTGILIVCILCGVVTAATTISDTSISVDNLILGGQTIVAYTTALNTKLSGIEALADVTDTTNVNSAGAVMESDIPDQSFTNLFENGDFESWSAGTAAAPDGWTIHGAGATITRDAVNYKIGSYGAAITNNGVATDLRYAYGDYESLQARSVSVGVWCKCSTASKARISIYDGAHHYGEYHTGGDGWEWLTNTYTVAGGASNVLIQMRIEGTDVITAYYDGAILVEGSVCPTFSQKPIVDDSIMLQSHTPSSASDYGLTGQWCYNDEYIYVCNATDTWIRTPLTTW